MLDILIKNGYVVDGTNNPWTKLDVAIQNGKIVEMKKTINDRAIKEIDATGKVVSPGFIDTHVHSDLLCIYPEIHQIKLKQGVTTELLGQDGISVAPVNHNTKELWQKQLKGLNGDIGDWDWLSVADYLTHLRESNILGNMAYLVPHGNVRTLVMGFEKREATRQEMTEMRKHVEEGLEQGALGFSSGLVYPPNVFSNTEEIIEICKGVAEYDGCFVVHMRNESFNILEAVDEMIQVAIESGVRLHLSHLKVIGVKNRQYYPQIIEKIEKARSLGIEVTFDQYPYTAGSTVFNAILPPWTHDGGTEEMLARLKDPNTRKKIKYELEESRDFENWVYNCGWENIIVSSVGSDNNKKFEGKSVSEIAELRETTAADAAFDLLIEEKGNITMVVHWGLEEDMESAMESPYHIVGSDSIFGGKPHPRLSGTQPRVLSRYVREKGILRLEEAIHHMTGAAAQLLRLDKRGILQKDYWADVVVFDPDEVADKSTYDEPNNEPVGIDYVIVNGQICVEEGECHLTGNGSVLA
ncbi:N-acyl-D-amino-acid deacylase [Lentibacillus persicus]|uniref:N-acyl-D-amino-acid deacylase n=1 Tax=Lentibacillus persicus TaxID=640948 RepID=A0A1I1VZZ0_9BACI|nr:D-aminoacylase [Lentibacillus persicus]SFD88395.1 N-acyl-D-amino-acid deacylase [Lentibacillus persicus]